MLTPPPVLFTRGRMVFMRKIGLTLTALLLFILWLSPSAAVRAAEPQATELGGADLTLTVAETDGILTVNVHGKQLKDVYAFELLFEYDPLRMELTGARTDVSGFTLAPMRDGKQILLAHTKTGSVSGINGDAKLAVLTFKRIRGGDAAVLLKEAKLVDSSLAMKEAKQADSVAFLHKQVRPKLTDIDGHWAEERIRMAVELGFVSGYGDSAFGPSRPVTRAEFAAMLSRALLLKGSGDTSFTDNGQIPRWAREAVATAAEAGLIHGYDDGTFRAERLINRAEMTVMIIRALGVQPVAGAEPGFADVANIPNWAKPSVKLAVDQGLMQGRGGNVFSPLEQATRAEAVSLILNLLSKKAGW